MTAKKNFFISYNSNNKVWAEWIAWVLEENGYSTVLQAWDFKASSNFVQEMDTAIKTTERTIAVLSKNYVEANFTKPEWQAAFRDDPTGENGKLVTVRIEDFKLEGLLAQITYIDLVGLSEKEAEEKLLAEISQKRRKPSQKPQFPGQSERSVPDQPKYPGTLLDIWNVPHTRNPFFTGRTKLLASLSKSLTSGKATALTQPQAIHGLGGVGKTQLAAEYCWQNKDNYEVIWWVRAEEPTTLATDYGELAVKLGLITDADTKLEQRVGATKDWLNSKTSWLLVLDNAEEQDDVKEYIPNTGTGHVIITSRNPVWGGTAKGLKVKIMESKKAVEFLLKRSGKQDKKAAAELAKELGYLPLAMEQAGAYMETTGQSLAGYLKLFREQCETLLGHSAGCGDYGETVRTTWEISFNRVKEKSAAAAELLNLCAFLAPEDIPLEIVKQGAEHLPTALKEVAGNEVELDKAVAALIKYSLLERRDNLLSLHRLVQEVLRERLSEDERKAWAGRTCKLMDEIFPFDWNDPSTWEQSTSLLPHAQAAAVYAERLETVLGHVAHILNNIGSLLHRQAAFKQALAAYQKALHLAEQEFGQDHKEVAAYANNLGEVLRNLGDLEGAKKHYERAIIIYEAAYGLDHQHVATSVNNLGIVLKDMGDYLAAKAHYERALRIDEAAFGPDNPAVARDLNNLGGVLAIMGELTGAKEHYERALKIDEAAYVPDHTAVAMYLNNLGSILENMGELKTAKEHYERALRIRRKFLVEDHPDTINTMAFLEGVNKKLQG